MLKPIQHWPLTYNDSIERPPSSERLLSIKHLKRPWAPLSRKVSQPRKPPASLPPILTVLVAVILNDVFSTLTNTNKHPPLSSLNETNAPGGKSKLHGKYSYLFLCVLHWGRHTELQVSCHQDSWGNSWSPCPSPVDSQAYNKVKLYFRLRKIDGCRGKLL